MTSGDLNTTLLQSIDVGGMLFHRQIIIWLSQICSGDPIDHGMAGLFYDGVGKHENSSSCILNNYTIYIIKIQYIREKSGYF